MNHQRPLAKRGIKAATVMGRLLAAAEQNPDRVISSSAVRAHETVKLAAKEGNWDCPIEIANALYEATPAQVLATIHHVPNETETLLLAGHEPTWSTLTSLLIGGGQIRFPTAAMARIDFDLASWKQLEYGKGRLIWLLQPRFFT